MNPIDDQLNRLFRAAAQDGAEPVSTPAFGLETRVMAAWRAAQSVEAGFWDMTLLARGLIVASVIMAVSFLPVLTSTDSGTSASSTSPFAEFLHQTDSTISPDDAS